MPVTAGERSYGEPPTRCSTAPSPSTCSQREPGRCQTVAARPGGPAGFPTPVGCECSTSAQNPPVARSTVWVVSEWVEGQSLTDAVAPRAAARPRSRLTWSRLCAGRRRGRSGRRSTRSAAPRRGVVAGRRQPAADRPGDPPSARRPDDVADDPTAHDDVRGSARCSTPPSPGAGHCRGGTACPPVQPGRRDAPGASSARVGRDLDEIVARALDGGYGDAAVTFAILDGLPQAPLVASCRRRRFTQTETGWRRIAWWVVPAAAGGGVGVAAWTAGQRSRPRARPGPGRRRRASRNRTTAAGTRHGLVTSRRRSRALIRRATGRGPRWRRARRRRRPVDPMDHRHLPRQAHSSAG